MSLLGTGLSACVVDEADSPSTALVETELTAVGTPRPIALALPDEAGVLHNAFVMTSADVALSARDLMRGAQAIVRPGANDSRTQAARTTFAQRNAAAGAAIAAASADHTALVAVVFEDSAVVGWRGPMAPAAANAVGGAQTNGGAPFGNDLLTRDPARPIPSTSYYCNAGAGAHVDLRSASTTSTNVNFLWGAPFPGGVPIYATVLLANGGTMHHDFPPTFFGSWYYITSQQTGPVGTTTGVTAVIDCYWYGI